MLIRVGEVEATAPEVGPIKFRVVQALDPVFELPVAQIAIPIGEQTILIGDAIAGREDAGKLIVPDFIPPSELRPDEQQ